MEKRSSGSYRFKYIFPLVLLIILIAIGCTRPHERNRSILLDDTSCEPPCWENITPGVTNIEDALSNLEKINGISEGPFFQEDIDHVKEKQKIGWYFPTDIEESFGIIHFQNNLVSIMRFTPESITIGELVDLIGDPEEIFIVKNRHESTWIWFDLLYPSKGIIIEYINFSFCCDDTGFFDLENDIEPTNVYYFDPILYEELLDDVVFVADFIWVPDEQLQQAIKDWSGFGLIEYKDLTKLRK